MAVSDLLNRPHDDATWNQWSFGHRDSHKRILQALAAKGITLTEYVLEPITKDDLTGFLQRNSQMHLDMTGATHISANNLQDVDLNNKDQFESWLFLHWREHSDVESALGI